MKIGFITPFFSPVAGGSAIVPYQLAKHLVRKGHKVFIFTSNFGRNLAKFDDENELVIIESKIKLKMANILYTPSLKFDLENSDELDILHFHNFRTYQNYVAYNYAKTTNMPYILQAHGSIPRLGKSILKLIYDIFFGYQLLRDATKVIALSHVEAEQYRAMGVPEEKIAIIPNGIDLSEYVNLPPKGAFKKKFNIPEDGKIILYLGRIHKIKGIDILIKAYAYMRNKMNLRDIVLVIAGPDDGYLNEAKRLAQALDVSNHVLFTGPLYGEDKMAAYIDSEVYVLPSRYETFPMAILEAYACGKPVVASEVGGLRDLVKNGETGLLFKPEDVKQLAERISNILNDDKMAEEMGLRGRNFVEEDFTIEKIIEKLEKLYEEVVEK
jgi:glycosyltransferase involved in cell wall biosynthesis